MPKQFTLECGATLEYEHVPTIYARAIAHARYPEPAKPTRQVEVAKDVFDEREYESPEWRRKLEHYNEYIWPIASRMSLIDLAVIDESVPPIDQAKLAARRARIPKEYHYSDKADWIVTCLMRSTFGDDNELARLTAAILENDFTFAEVESAAREMKSEG